MTVKELREILSKSQDDIDIKIGYADETFPIGPIITQNGYIQLQSDIDRAGAMTSLLASCPGLKGDKTPIEGSDIDANVQALVNLYDQGRLVPVVCEDMFEFKSDGGDIQKLHTFLIGEALMKCHKDKGVTFSDQELNRMLSDRYYGVSLLESKINKDINDILYNLMFKGKEIRHEVCLREDVKSFLEIGQFPLIITTSCFPIIEKELKPSAYKDYWNIMAQKENKSCHENQLDFKQYNYVYHIFGKAQLMDANWCYNDKQLLNYLLYIYKPEYALTNLTSYLNDVNLRKILLVLGNDTPDWLFRFVLSPIYGRSVYSNGPGYYMSDRQSADGGLNLFLKGIEFINETDLSAVMQGFVKELKNRKLEMETDSKEYEPHNKEYDFFISHASEDSQKITGLVARLKESGLKVWVDDAKSTDGGILNEGEEYWKNIITALKKSRYFLPILTANYLGKAKEKGDRESACKKLKIAQSDFLRKKDEVDQNESQCAYRLSQELSGVMAELMMAEQWMTLRGYENYCVPVIILGERDRVVPIDQQHVESYSHNSLYFPEKLFRGRQMATCNLQEVGKFAFNAGWDYFKYNH